MDWLNDAWEAIKSWFSSDAPEAVTTPCDNALTEQQAQDLFDDMAGQADIPFDYTPDCCYARAHRMSDLMRNRGIESRKAWAYGSLRPNNADGSRVEFPAGRPVTWGYHVAPTVLVRGADGACREMVIDPSLRDRPLTVDEWEATMGGASSRAMTDSEVYLHRPDMGFENLSQAEIGVDDTSAAFARHVATRDRVNRP